MRIPAGNLLIPGLLFVGLQAAPNEEPIPVQELSWSEAWDRVIALSEVRRLSIESTWESLGACGLFVMGDGEYPPGHWNFFVGEDTPDFIHRVWTLRVSSFTGEISVLDVVGDEYVPLERWRRLTLSR